MERHSLNWEIRQKMETKIRKQTQLEELASIIQIGHVDKLTSEQIANRVIEYIWYSDYLRNTEHDGSRE